MKVLFVCTGNTCRSIMAEGIARFLHKQFEDKPNIEFYSAGIAAYPGSPSSKNAVEVMLENNIDIANHKSAQLTIELIEDADIILTMTEGHKLAIGRYFEKGQDKVFTLKEYVNGLNIPLKDINDPFGGNIDTYRKCAQELKVLIAKVLEKISRSH